MELVEQLGQQIPSYRAASIAVKAERLSMPKPTIHGQGVAPNFLAVFRYSLYEFEQSRLTTAKGI